jgi:hypothetical protein
VVITIGGHAWHSRVASMGDRFIVGISAASRAASGIAEATWSRSASGSTPSRG